MTVMTTTERLGFEARVVVEKDVPLVRGWKVGGEPEVQSAIALYNQKEYERCKQAALALIKI